MPKGTVRWFDDRKGYGFIEPEEGNADVFVHFTGIAKQGAGRRSLDEGDAVRYEMGESKGKACAINVELI